MNVHPTIHLLYSTCFLDFVDPLFKTVLDGRLQYLNEISCTTGPADQKMKFRKDYVMKQSIGLRFSTKSSNVASNTLAEFEFVPCSRPRAGNHPIMVLDKCDGGFSIEKDNA
jgi:hypothetical protein